jgi:phospholipid-binding lipoprotein MlaA
MGITTFSIVNSTSLKLGQYESIKKDALDLYPFLRDIYTQARKKQIEE